MGGHCRLSLASNTNHHVRWWCLTIKVTVLRTSEEIKMNRFNFSGWLTVQNVSDKWRGDTKRPAGAGWWLLATSSDPEHLLNVFPQPINQSRVSYTFISATTNHFTGNCRGWGCLQCLFSNSFVSLSCLSLMLLCVSVSAVTPSQDVLSSLSVLSLHWSQI